MYIDISDEDFLRKFESAEFSVSEWQHRSHVRLSFLYLHRYTFEEAIERVRSGIQKLNKANNVPDEPERGYHETITRAWMQIIVCAMERHAPETDFAVFAETHTYLLSKSLLYLFYSKHRLISEQAKREFVSPDITELPPR
jgi:hypothetical protein